MAGRRKYGRNKRGGKRWRNYRRGIGQLVKDIKMLKSMINVERKHCDVQQDITIDDDWHFYPLSVMEEGDDWNQRNGRKVKASSNYLNGQLYIDNDAAKTNVRIVLFIDRDPDGEGVSPSEIFDYNDIQSPLNRSNAGSRFKIFYDRNFDLSINGRETATVKAFNRLFHHVNYLNASADTSAQGPGNIFMGIITNEPTNQPHFNFINRFSYIDN